MSVVQVSIAGRSVDIVSDPDDPYIADAVAHAAAMDHLAPLLARVPNDAVIFDVGANVGFSAIYMAIVKPKARIHAFEPGPRTFAHLRANTAAFPNITPVHAAVSSQPGELSIRVPENSATAYVVVDSERAADGQVDTVPCIRLDDYASELKAFPDFIKVDVEGHEPEVLAGAAEVVSQYRPLLYVEFNSWTLMAFGDHSPMSFASALVRNFDIEGRGSALALVHSNMVLEGCVSDLTMRIKPDAIMPSLAEMSLPARARISR